jgi:ABC-2 type transport system permease protein
VSWADVLRRDLLSTFRSRLGPSVAIVMLLSTVGVAGLIVFFADPEHPPDMESVGVMLGSLLSFVVPLVALMASFSAIVSERMTGSVRFLLGLPNSRTDAFVGKFLSRGLLVVVPLVVGLLVAGGVLVPIVEEGSYLYFVALAGLTTVYAVLFVSIGLTASVVAETDNRSVGIVVGVFTILRAGWPAFQWAGLEGMEHSYPRPAWFYWFGRINPINAYIRLTNELHTPENHPLITVPREDRSVRRFGEDVARETMAGSFVVSAEFASLVLAVTTVVVPLVGYLYFRQRDML